ncbi:MAG: porin [Dysgonamonadaceae bacterium]
MKKSKIWSVLSLCALFTLQANAQEPTLKVSPAGRVLLDGAVYNSNNSAFGNGISLSDVRLGAKLSYGSYKAKIDIGFANSSLSIKDVILEKELDHNNIFYGGYFIHQYGLQSATSSSMKIAMEEPASNTVFNDPRLLGVMYQHDKGKFMGTLSAHVENQAINSGTQTTGNQGYGFRSRLLFHPFYSEGKILQFGISGAYQTPTYNSNANLNHNSFSFSSGYPTRVASLTAIAATVSDAKNMFKYTPELLAAYGPVALESQYFYNQVNRDGNAKAYKASGAYATVRGLIFGGKYKYASRDGGIDTPGAGAMEAVVQYNYTDMSSPETNIYGGRMNDIAIGFNYYINKNMLWRVRYSYTDVRDRANVDNTHLNAFQTRLQIMF